MRVSTLFPLVSLLAGALAAPVRLENRAVPIPDEAFEKMKTVEPQHTIMPPIKASHQDPINSIHREHSYCPSGHTEYCAPDPSSSSSIPAVAIATAHLDFPVLPRALGKRVESADPQSAATTQKAHLDFPVLPASLEKRRKSITSRPTHHSTRPTLLQPAAAGPTLSGSPEKRTEPDVVPRAAVDPMATAFPVLPGTVDDGNADPQGDKWDQCRLSGYECSYQSTFLEGPRLPHMTTWANKLRARATSLPANNSTSKPRDNHVVSAEEDAALVENTLETRQMSMVDNCRRHPNLEFCNNLGDTAGPLEPAVSHSPTVSNSLEPRDMMAPSCLHPKHKKDPVFLYHPTSFAGPPTETPEQTQTPPPAEVSKTPSEPEKTPLIGPGFSHGCHSPRFCRGLEGPEGLMNSE